MRTENPSPPPSAVALIRTQLSRARRSVWARGPAVRWLAAAVVLGVLASVAYQAASPAAGKYLGEGRQYPNDEIAAITRGLEAQQIEYRVEDRRIGVATDRYDDAMSVAAKLDLGPRTIGEIRKKNEDSPFWISLTEKERLEFRRQEEMLEAMIRSLDDIVSATVTIYRTRTRVGRPAVTASAFVWLETRDDRKIGPNTVQSIKGIITGMEPELKQDAVSLWDRKGRKYLDPGDPGLDELSRTRAHEEEITQNILEDLSWIKGVQVTVQLVAASTRAPAVAPVPAPVSPPAPAPSAAPPPAGPEVRVNEPIDDDVALPESKSAPPPAVASSAPPPPAPVPAPAAAAPEFARVLVKVPRSFYYVKALPNRNPSLEDLQSIQGRTESIIETAVGYVLPPRTFEVSIATIPDDVPVRDPLVAPAVPETRRWPTWAIPAAAGGSVAALLLGLGLLWLATRRPRRAPAAESMRGRYTSESGLGHSERVRELIRHNPKAAASVLHRWIGQGGHSG